MRFRINKLRKKLRQNNLQAFFITSKINRIYLTDFSGSKGDLLVAKNMVYLFTDSRYGERAERETDSGIEVVSVNKDYLAAIKDLLNQLKIKKLGIEADSISLRFFEKLRKNFRGVKLIKTDNLVKEIRAVKDGLEIKNLKKAANITDQAFMRAIKFIRKNFKKGLAEKRIAWEIEKFIKEHCGDGLSFDSIIASGRNSSIPHHLTGQRRIRKGDQIIMDFGALVNGYHADMTRTIFIGAPDAKQRKVYETVLAAQKRIINMIKPGISGKKLDRIAKDIIAECGYAGKFTHGLGHGVGLEIHELPSLSIDKEGGGARLKNNMVLTVEPGIYLSGRGGVRIEDMVIIQNGRARVLTKSFKDIERVIVKG